VTYVRNKNSKSVYDLTLETGRSYAKELIERRSFGDYRDALKPVQRRILYKLLELSKQNERVATAKLCTAVAGELHARGVDSVYAALVSMADDPISPIVKRSVLGSKVSSFVPAMRYTYVGLSALGKEMLSTLDLSTYVKSEVDEAISEPEALLLRFPYHLFGYQPNIGYGYGNTMLNLNAEEVMNAMVKYLSDMMYDIATSTEELADLIHGPDLYENHTVYTTKESIHSLIDKGIGHCTVVSAVAVDSKAKTIIIKELPYREKSDNLHEKISKMVYEAQKKNSTADESDKLYGVKGTRNASVESDIYIELTLDPTKATTEQVLDQLYNKTNLKKGYTKELYFTDENRQLNIYTIREIFNGCIQVNHDYYINKYQKELDALERKNDENFAIMKIIKNETTKKQFGELMYKHDKVELAIKQLGLTEEECTQIIFRRNILNRFSKKDEIEAELASYQSNKVVIEEKMQYKNIMKETLEYLEYIKHLVSRERQSKVVYSQVSTITPKIINEAEVTDQLVIVNDKLQVKSDSSNMYSYHKNMADTKYVFSLKDRDSIVAVCEGVLIKIPVKELGNKAEPLSLFGIGDQVSTIIPMSEKGINEGIWYFVNNLGEIKAVTEEEMYSKLKEVKYGRNEPDASIIDIFKLTDAEVESQTFMLGTISRKGFLRLSAMYDHIAKNRQASFKRFTKLDADDEIVQSFLIQYGFGSTNVTVRFKDGTTQEVVLDQDYHHKPVLNRGEQISKTRQVTGLSLDVGEFRPSMLITEYKEDGTYVTTFVTE
jgi:DNA gyrase/topoisomerase IV subunit A